MASFPGQPGKPASERLNLHGVNEARSDGEAVALVGPYANQLHLAPCR